MTGVLFPLVVAIVAGGVVITAMTGDYEHWIPILLALGVVGGVATSAGR